VQSQGKNDQLTLPRHPSPSLLLLNPVVPPPPLFFPSALLLLFPCHCTDEYLTKRPRPTKASSLQCGVPPTGAAAHRRTGQAQPPRGLSLLLHC